MNDTRKANKLGRALSVLLVFCMVAAMLPAPTFAAVTASGTIGTTNPLNWSLEDTGVLTISGTGTMDNLTAVAEQPWAAYAADITSVVIDSGVTTIGSMAFMGCTALTSVSLPTSVTSIGSEAFSGCTVLTTIDLSNVTLIQSNAFMNCSGLATADLSGLTNPVMSYTFKGCTTLASVTLPVDLTTIGNGAFENCTSLTALTFPTTLNSVGQNAFNGCTNLGAITYAGTETQWNAVSFGSGNDQLTAAVTATITASVDTDLKSITFTSDKPLADLAALSASTNSIASSSITAGTTAEVVMDDILTADVTFTFPTSCFTNFVLTKTVDVAKPDNAGTCGESGHEAEVTWSVIGGTLTISGTARMADYTAVSQQPWYEYKDSITAIVINDGVKGIGASAFEGLAGAETVTFPATLEKIGSYAFSKTGLETLDLTAITVTVLIDVGVFSECTSLESAVLPTAVQFNGYNAATLGSYIISDNLFYGCSSLIEITIPDLTGCVGNSTFAGCTSLSKVNYGGTKWDTNAMTLDSGNEPLTAAVTAAAPTATAERDGSGDVTVTVTSTTPFDTSLTAAQVLAKVSIDPSYSLSAASLTDENTLVVTLHPATTVTEITEMTFAGLHDRFVLGDATVSKVTDVAIVDLTSGSCGTTATYSYNSATGVLTIGGTGAIDDYTGNAPWAAYAADITSVVIPSGITAIGDQAFAGCSELTSIVIPSGVTSIGEGAFAGCTKLETVTLPVSLTAVGAGAFGDCTALGTVYYDGTPTNWSGITVAASNAPLTSAVTLGDKAPATITWDKTRSDGSCVVTVTSSKTFASGATLGETGTEDVVISVTPAATYTVSFSGKTLTLTFATNDALTVGMTFNASAFQPLSAEPFAATGSKTVTATIAAYSPGGGGGTHGGLSGGSSSKDKEEPAEEIPEIPLPETPIVPPPAEETASPLQEIVKETPSGNGHTKVEYVDWVERVELPDYAETLYTVMCDATVAVDAGSTAPSNPFDGVFIDDSSYKIDANALSGAKAACKVVSAEEITFVMYDHYADDPSKPAEQGSMKVDAFSDDSYIKVGTTPSDAKVKYSELKLGDVVKTAGFNGVYVTSVKKTGNANYDAEKKKAAAYISTVFHAFDRDHPEVFWLSGKCRVRMMNVSANSVETTYFFLALADKDGFSMRSPEWSKAGAVEEGIKRRDAAVDKILATVTATDAPGKIKQLNQWLTENNEYNTTPDLTTIGNEPHECLRALEGNIGPNGPVCDGYSRAFKTLCDRLEIPCVLENGFARSSTTHAGEMHMWTSVQVNGVWFGADITWNDPLVRGKSVAKSGYENEKFLMVGLNTEINGLLYSYSHPVSNKASADGVAFINGPELSEIAFSAMTANAGLVVLPFTDVAENAWYHDAVQYVYENGIMNGATANTFEPDSATSRGMVVTVLYRIAGEPEVTAAGAFDDVDPNMYYATAIAWAAASGIVDGYGDGNFGPNDPVKRQELAAILWRYVKLKNYTLPTDAGVDMHTLADVDDVAPYAVSAMEWACGVGIMQGDDNGMLLPNGSANRAETATMLMRFHIAIGAVGE